MEPPVGISISLPGVLTKRLEPVVMGSLMPAAVGCAARIGNGLTGRGRLVDGQLTKNCEAKVWTSL